MIEYVMPSVLITLQGLILAVLYKIKKRMD